MDFQEKHNPHDQWLERPCAERRYSRGPLRRSNFNKAIKWKQAAAAIGVPDLHLHDLRHTGNTLAAGTPGASTAI